MKYKIIVDKQSRANPSEEKKEYIVDVEELRVKGNIYDSLVITKDETYVMRRLSLSELQVLSVLEKPIKQSLGDLNVELFEGDNYIYLLDMTGNKFYAEYLVKNEFTEMYVTNAEMNSAINQTAQQIELTVNQKLTSYSTIEELIQTKDEVIETSNINTDDKLKKYSTTVEMNTAINMKANEIQSTVSETYSTKNETATAKQEAIDSANESTDNKLDNYSTTVEMNSAITQKANEITQKVESTYETKTNVDTKINTAKSEIKQTTDSISSEVSKKVGNDEIISKINQSAEAVQINADKISLERKRNKFDK